MREAHADQHTGMGLGASHHWIIDGMLGLSYERPAHQMRDYLEVLNAALRGPGSVDVENERYRVHSPIDVTDWGPNPVVLAALGPVMLRLAGEQTSGTILWMADVRAVAEHVVPRITKAAAGAANFLRNGLGSADGGVVADLARRVELRPLD